MPTFFERRVTLFTLFSLSLSLCRFLFNIFSFLKDEQLYTCNIIESKAIKHDRLEYNCLSKNERLDVQETFYPRSVRKSSHVTPTHSPWLGFDALRSSLRLFSFSIHSINQSANSSSTTSCSVPPLPAHPWSSKSRPFPSATSPVPFPRYASHHGPV